MKEVVVIGAGKIGATVAGLLAATGDYQVTLADRSPEVLARLDSDERIRIAAADVEDSSKLVDLLNGQFAVLNAAPFHLTTVIAEAARAARTHYLDLTEDVAGTAPCEGARGASRRSLHSAVRACARASFRSWPSTWRSASISSTASSFGSGHFLNTPRMRSTIT